MRKKIKKSASKRTDLSFSLSIGIVGFFLLLTAGFALTLPSYKLVCANSISCISDLTGIATDDNKGVFMGQAVTAPDLPDKDDFAYADSAADESVLADQTGDYKRIYVDLTNQRLYAFEGDNQVMNFPVSTGKWYPTPTGEFRVWIWLRSTRMSGGSGAGYYNLPNVPYTMYFYNNEIPKYRGYAIHGAYWHNNFGNPMSHGCVNMKIEDAEKLFYWTNSAVQNVAYPGAGTQGTLVTIYGMTPKR
jgi:hypothetical protein